MKRGMNDMVPRKAVRKVPVKTQEEEPVVLRSKEIKVKEYSISHEPLIPAMDDDERIKHAQDLLDQLEERRHHPVLEKRSGTLFPRWIIWSIVVIALVVLGLAGYTLFSKATVTAVLKTQKLSVDTTLIGKKDDPSGDVTYTTITRTLATSTTIISDEKVTVDTSAKAAGTIRIFNAGTTAQTLVKGTRFESKAGVIYRTQKEISIPARTGSGSSAKPGSVDATIISDTAGEQGVLLIKDLKGDFTVPGLKGTPRYTSIYGRQTTDFTLPFKTGGFDEVSLRKSLIETAKRSMLTDMQKSVPEGYVLYDALVTSSNSSEEGEATGDSIKLSENITVTAVLIRGTDLAAALLPVEKTAIKGGALVIEGLENLTVDLKNTSTYSPNEGTPILVSAKGSLYAHKPTTEASIQQALAGKSLRQTQGIINSFQSIEHVSYRISPFWAWQYPSDPSRITVLFNTSTSSNQLPK